MFDCRKKCTQELCLHDLTSFLANYYSEAEFLKLRPVHGTSGCCCSNDIHVFEGSGVEFVLNCAPL